MKFLNSIRNKLEEKKVEQEIRAMEHRVKIASVELGEIRLFPVPDDMAQKIDAFGEVSADNIDAVREFLDSNRIKGIRRLGQTIASTKKFIREIEDQDGKLILESRKFFKTYKIDYMKFVNSLDRSPDILQTVGMGQMFGGAIGTAYAAKNLIGVAAGASRRAGWQVSTGSMKYYRRLPDLTEEEKAKLVLLCFLYYENVITELDFNKAIYSIAWNNADCRCHVFDRKTAGAFDEVQLDESDTVGLNVSSHLIKKSVTDVQKTFDVISELSAKLSDPAKKYLKEHTDELTLLK